MKDYWEYNIKKWPVGNHYYVTIFPNCTIGEASGIYDIECSVKKNSKAEAENYVRNCREKLKKYSISLLKRQ